MKHFMAPTKFVVCLVFLAKLCLAQDESAAIIQTTIMEFNVTGQGAMNFSTQAQTDFSTNLRQLLNPFNFMSVAVSDFKEHSTWVDVSVRAVDATDALNLTDTWSKISNQTVAGTFTSAFNALLMNSGVQMNASVLSITGASTPAGISVNFAVQVELNNGMNLSPFSSSSQQSFLSPINSFLGDHGNASIGSFAQTGTGVNVDLNLTMDANTMPQFFFFIQNTSLLQSSLPSLGGNSLQLTVGNTSTYGSNAPIAASAPAALKAVAPAPIALIGGPITAQQATGNAAVPPVTSSTSGTVTMNIEMTLFGSGVQPFNSTVQFAAASSMASVFWIIVGTGSVNLISFTSWNASGEPVQTALGSTQQYGRKMLQFTSTIPAENCTFAVTVPTATQNSLLVLQSSSPTVLQQFGGWFVTQMASRGLTVDAAVNSVTLSGTSNPSSPSNSSPATSSSSHSGGGSNTGAIVGGVVGGICGAVLLAGLVGLFLVMRSRRRNSKAVQKSKSMESDSSDDMRGAIYWEPAQKRDTSPIYTRDAETLKKTIVTMLTTSDGSYNKIDSRFFHSPLHSKLTEVDSANAENVKSLLQRKQQQSQQLIETNSYKSEILLSALSALEPGTLYYNKYAVEASQRKGLSSVLAYATLKDSPSTKVVIKFLPNEERYTKEKLFYENRQALEGEAATAFIPSMMDAFEGTHSSSLGTETDSEIPSSVVLQRGSFTLQEYLTGKADLTAKPEAVNKSNILSQLCMCVSFMHERHLVHGAITTDHVMWFPEEKRWKIMGFTNWARSGDNMRLDYDLHYAAPELVLADLARMTSLPAKESVDMWALGCIAFELLSGRPLFGAQYSDEEIMAMLLGFVKLPWENNPDFFVDTLAPSSRTFVADLLQRAPEARKPIATLLHSPLLAGSVDAQRTQGPTTELQTPANINSSMSDW